MYSSGYNRRGAGFTKLILLIALAAGTYYGYQYYQEYIAQNARDIEKAKQGMEILMKKVDKYVDDMGQYPENMQALQREGYFEEGDWPMATPWGGDYSIHDGYIECHIDNLQAQPLKRPFQGDLKWNVKYTPETLPEKADPPWKKLGGAKTFISGNQELVFEDSSRSEYVFYWLLDPYWHPLDHRGFTLEVEMRTDRNNTTDVAIRIMDGNNHSTISFYPSYIAFCRGNSEEKERLNVKTDNRFHTYRITLKKGKLVFYIDGVQRLETSSVHTRGTYDRRLGFGTDGSGNGKAIGKFRYINLSLEGTFRP